MKPPMPRRGWPRWRRRVAKHKYHAKPTYFDGHWYGSAAEAHRAKQLNLLVAVREIETWKRQVTVKLVKGFKCRVDFLVTDIDGNEWYEDVKGMETQRSRDIKRLWEHHGPLPLVLLKRKGSGWTREFIERTPTAAV